MKYPVKTSKTVLILIIVFIGLIPFLIEGLYQITWNLTPDHHPLAQEKHVCAYYYPWYANGTDYTNPAMNIRENDDGKQWTRWVSYNYTLAPYLTDEQEFYWNYGGSRNYSMASVAHWPKEGCFDSSDPAYILRTFEKCKAAGVDILICDYGNNYGWQNAIINNTMNVADQLLAEGKWAPKITIMAGVSEPDYVHYCDWQAQAHGFEPGNGSSCLAFQVGYGLDLIADHPSCFRVGGKMVIFTWSHYVPGYENWAGAMEILRARYDFYLLADWGYYEPGPIPPRWLDIVDGVIFYNPVGYLSNSKPVPNVPNKYTNLPDLDWANDPTDPNKGIAPEIVQYGHIQSPTIRQMYRNMARYLRANDKFFAPTVIPGYDDRMIYPHAHSYVGRTETTNYGSGLTYDGMWEDALETKPAWVVICSWNEWHEGTEIDESVEYGDLFLQRTRYYSDIFLSI